MLNASITTTLGVAALIGTALTYYLWRIRRHQLEVRRGLAALASMRWRESFGFIVDALQAQGFEPGPREPSTGPAGQRRELRLTRAGASWLLGFRQAPDERVDASHVAGFAGSVRASGASGGILAVLGPVQKGAGDNSPGIELLHGEALWALVEPRLPAGLLKDLGDRARQAAIRETALGWGLSVLAGVVVAFAMPGGTGGQADPTVPLASAPTLTPEPTAPSTSPAAEPAVATISPPETTTTSTMPAIDESIQRQQIVKRLGKLAGVERAAWSTRSTLVVMLDGVVADGPELTRALCAVVSDYVDLRASRLQLQPPEGSDRRVRFMQCHAW